MKKYRVTVMIEEVDLEVMVTNSSDTDDYQEAIRIMSEALKKIDPSSLQEWE